jgi:hypothetical protein
VNLNQFPLSDFEVDCDGSACGSGRTAGPHVHPPQGGIAIARVMVRENTRLCYRPAEGITRLIAAA